MDDVIYRQAAIDEIARFIGYIDGDMILRLQIALKRLSSATPDSTKYEYHYDHTDCIWYSPGKRSKCPSTCAQYRDGWNDAMNYIFRDGKGYRPFKRGEQYGE